MITYISGSITNDRVETTRRFVYADGWLRLHGYKPIASLRLHYDLVDTLSESDLRKVKLDVIAVCDCVLMLPQWQESVDCCIELEYAKALGKKIIYFAYYDDGKEMDKDEREYDI